MPPQLHGTGVFTNVMGASLLANLGDLPYGSAARLDYVLVLEAVEVRGWYVPEELSHCSNMHCPVITSVAFGHAHGSGTCCLASHDNAMANPDQVFQYLSMLSSASLRSHMGLYGSAWAAVAKRINNMCMRSSALSQDDLDRLWAVKVLGPAAAIGKTAKEQHSQQPQAGVHKCQAGEVICNRAQYVQSRLRTAVMHLYQWHAYLRNPPCT